MTTRQKTGRVKGLDKNPDKDAGTGIYDLKDGYHLGGVGVSGSSGSNDEKCALKAIEKGLEVIYD